MLEALVAALVVVGIVGVAVNTTLAGRVAALEAALRAGPPPAPVDRRPPPAPGVAPRGTPYHGGRLPTRPEAPTTPTRVLDTAQLVAWDAEVAGLPAGYMADGSPVAYRPDGSFARAHETYRHRYEPLGANQRAMVLTD